VSTIQELRDRRRARLRYQLRQKSHGRPRLSVFRSSKNMHAQIIDDAQGRTLAAASSLDKDLRAALRTGADKAAAAALFTPKHIDFVSKRLGNFQFNSQFYWMVTQSWVQ